jgi:hypothetical protein
MAQIVYKSREGFRLTQEQAETFGPIIYSIIEENEGKEVPQRIVDSARDETSPMHFYFEWDDEIAGEQWRLSQARYMARAIVIIQKSDKKTSSIRAFVCISNSEDNENTKESRYAFSITALQDEKMYQNLLKNAMKQLIQWKKQYENFKEFRNIIMEIDKISSQMDFLDD